MNKCSMGLCKSRWVPILLVAFLMLIHFLSGYPGGMTADSIAQFRQSLVCSFASHNPPLMAMLWSVLNYIHSGPQVMLLLHLSLLWGGVLFLYYADTENKYRWLYFVIPFVPNVLFESTMVWKDIGFGNSFFFVFAGCVYYLYKKEKAPLWLSLIFLLIAFYGSAVKFQAKFALPVLLFFIVNISTNKDLLFKIVATAILSFTIIFGNGFIIDRFATHTNSSQMRQLFDIANIVKDIDDDSMLPDYIRNADIYSFEKLKEKTNHAIVNDLIFPEDRIFVLVQDKEKLDILENSFYKMVFTHPIYYLKHRLLNFGHMLYNSMSTEDRYAAMDYKEELHDLGIDTTAITFWQNAVISVIKIYPTECSKNLVSFLLVFIYIFTISKFYKVHSTEKTILSYVVVISMLFSFTMFFATMSYDYRYYYIVRVLSFFAIPICLKAILSKFEESK